MKKWKKVIGWTFAIIDVLILVIVVAGYFVLKSQGFHRYVLAKIVQQANEATGGQVEVLNFDFHFSKLTGDLYGLTIHGTEGSGERPLLQVNKLTVGLKIVSVIHHEVDLSEILIEHPVAHVVVTRDGRNNIPQPNAPKANSGTTVFDLAIGHVLLNNGEVYYNDRKTELDADLYDLKTDVRFSSLEKRYSGSLSYDNGHVKYAQYSPLPHSLDVQFSATPSQMSFEHLVLTVGSSRVALRANVTDYSRPRVDGSYDIRIHAQDFAAMSPGASPAGDLTLAGGIHYQSVADQAALQSVSLDGHVNSGGLRVTSPQGHVELHKIAGQYQLSNGTLRVRELAVDLLNGRVTADVNIQHLDTTPVSKATVSLRGISLEAAKQALNRPDLQRVPITGSMQGTANASWTGSIQNIRVSSDVAIRAAVWNNSLQPASIIPVDGAIHLNYDGPSSKTTLHQTVLRIPSTSITWQGELSRNSNLRIQASAGDLHQLALLASALRAAGSPPASSPIALSGTAMLDAVVQGPMQRPQLVGQLSAQNLQVEGSQWSSLRLGFKASPAEFSVQNGSLVNARQGSVTFNAHVGLTNWAYAESSPLTANLSARQMSVAELEHLANLQYPVTGNLSADVTFQGSQLNPVGHGSIQIVRASAYDEPIQNLRLQFQATGDSVNSTLNVSLPAGSATANLDYMPKSKAYNVRLDAPSMVLQKLQVVQAKNLGLSGTLRASASGAGTLDNPQLDASVQIPQLNVRQNTISGINAHVDVANHRANLTLASDVAQASMQAKGIINLTGDYYTEATIDTSRIPLDPLLAMYVPSRPSGFQGQTELHASLKGPLKDTTRLEAHLTIPTLSASYQALQIANQGPIRADYSNSVLVLQPSEISGTDTSLRFQGRVPLTGTADANVTAQGTINLRLLRIFSSELQSSGAILLDLHTSGAARNPEIRGQVRIQDASFSTPDAPVGLEKLNGTLDIANDRVQITNLKGQVGGGEISAGGSIGFRPSIQFNTALQGKSVRLLYPDGVRAVLDSNLAFTGSMQDASLNGQVLLDSLSFTPDFDLTSFASQFSGTSVPSSTPGFADNVKLRVSVQSTENLSAVSSQVSLEGQVNLQVIGTAANPVVVGRTDLNSGELFFMDQRYQLEQGVIAFTNPNQTEPVLNVKVTTKVEQYNLTLTLVGPIEKLRTEYTSDPPLPTVDIISLLYRGQTTAEASTAGQSTDSILASQVASQFSSSVQKLAGISSLQIDPLIGGNNQNPSARVAIQQRVTKNFLFTFSTDVTQPQSEIIQGEYQLTPRWSVSVVRDPVGGVSVDGRYHTKF